MRSLIASAVVLVGLSAQAEDVRVNPTPFGVQHGPTAQPGFRPPDDSDPEMQDYLVDQRPGACGSAEFCDKLKQFYTNPGERLTRYLIRQYEESVDGGYVSGEHYLVRIGKTQTPLAINYLLQEVARPRGPRYRRTALRSLGYVEDPRAVQAALDALDETGADVRTQQVAVTVIEENCRSLGWAPRAAIDKLQTLEEDQQLPVAVRRRAYAALNAIEDDGVTARRTSRPTDLEAWNQGVQQQRRALETGRNAALEALK